MNLLRPALGMGRRHARARMTETVTVGLFTDGTDNATGDPTRDLVIERYTGSARIKYPSLGVTPITTTSQDATAQQLLISVPTGSTPLHKGDEVVVSASTVDGSLVGRRYSVEGAPQAGQTTSLRYPLKEL